MTEPHVMDVMTEFAVAELASSDGVRVRSLVRRMAQRWPHEKALLICFALTSAASQIEDMFASDTGMPSVTGYKLSALVAADLLAIDEMGVSPATGQDLLHFWRRVDPWFLG